MADKLRNAGDQLEDIQVSTTIRGLPRPQYIVKASFDNDADVWHVEDPDVPDLSKEAATFEAFCRKTEVMVPELLEANGVESGGVEIIAHTMANFDRSAA